MTEKTYIISFCTMEGATGKLHIKAANLAQASARMAASHPKLYVTSINETVTYVGGVDGDLNAVKESYPTADLKEAVSFFKEAHPTGQVSSIETHLIDRTGCEALRSYVRAVDNLVNEHYGLLHEKYPNMKNDLLDAVDLHYSLLVKAFPWLPDIPSEKDL